MIVPGSTGWMDKMLEHGRCYLTIILCVRWNTKTVSATQSLGQTTLKGLKSGLLEGLRNFSQYPTLNKRFSYGVHQLSPAACALGGNDFRGTPAGNSLENRRAEYNS